LLCGPPEINRCCFDFSTVLLGKAHASSIAMTFGLLNIYKPAGQTSRWVVDRVQRLVKPAKAGHAGTLDPLATGVLMVCVGQATRLIEYVQQMPKRYRATFLLGRSSATEDTEGEITELENPPIPSRLEVETAAATFVGEIQQRPPAFSALKVAGQRAYKLARKGHAVELAPRPITIHWLQVMEYEYPQLTLELQCSSGTYVRSLGRDLAESLGSAAVMSKLKRTAIGKFRAEDAVDVTTLSRENLAQHLIPPSAAVNHLPVVQLNQAEVQTVFRGLFLALPAAADELPDAEFAAFDDCGNLAAILRRRRDGLLGPAMNFFPT
jgi:tRNA pseudouridine55 synthase